MDTNEDNELPGQVQAETLKLHHEFREGDGKEWPFFIIGDSEGRLRARVISYTRVSQGEAEALADLIVAAPSLQSQVASLLAAVSQAREALETCANLGMAALMQASRIPEKDAKAFGSIFAAAQDALASLNTAVPKGEFQLFHFTETTDDEGSLFQLVYGEPIQGEVLHSCRDGELVSILADLLNRFASHTGRTGAV